MYFEYKLEMHSGNILVRVLVATYDSTVEKMKTLKVISYNISGFCLT